MAKKRRQKVEKKEEYDFKLPEFDEHQFISLELLKAKTSLIAFLLAILMVVITFQLYTITYPAALGPIVLGVFGVMGLPIIIKYLKIDVSDFDWKNWVGTGAVYILTWLAVFILLCNPPFSDFIEPYIDEEKLEFTYQVPDNDTWQTWDDGSDIPILVSPIKINITVKIIDNSAIDKDSVKVMIKGPQNYSMKMDYIDNDQYRTILRNNDQKFLKGKYTYSIEAKDVYGHTSTLSNKRFEIF